MARSDLRELISVYDKDFRDDWGRFSGRIACVCLLLRLGVLWIACSAL